jgi:capsular polysaccharide biosynthesis protein
VGRGRLRLSHLDREHVIDVLKAAFVQGRLNKDEFDLRVGQALVSRTFVELATVTIDLPAGPSSARYPRRPAGARARPLVRKVVTACAYLVVPVAALGLLAGIAFGILTPPVFTSSTVVMLQSSAARFIGTQEVIAGSDPVLVGALQNTKSTMSLPALRSDVQVKIVTDQVISINARGATAAQAARTADAVADSYVAYIDEVVTPGHARARIIERTVGTTEAALPARLLVPVGLGALIGVIAALALSHNHRRSRIW